MTKQLDERLDVAVVARFERSPDLGLLWPPLAKKLRSSRAFMEAHPRVVSDLDENAWVRNAVGAHSNEEASAVTPDEVREFAGGLANLYVANHCGCGSFISKQRDGNWRCDCARLSFDVR